MSDLKTLLQNIHERSLWQVLGAYLAGSWFVLQVVETLNGTVGLPDWVGPGAFVLLVIGLPILLVTSFVQGGFRRRGDEPLSGSVPPILRFLTWRRALLGGVGAFTLLGMTTTAYLLMRSLGIGPAGTLVAQGLIEEGGKVVLADFAGSDMDLAELVTGALRIDLLQSPTIQIVERTELAAALRRMQLDDEADITAEVARELATREGYGAVIEGEARSAGGGYVLSANVVAGEDWSSVAAFREAAHDEDGLIDAIEALSRDIRDKSGESLRRVQSAPPLQQVTTASLEALRTYSRAEKMEYEGDRRGAVQVYERAIEIDPAFAMAHRKLAVNLRNLGVRRSDEVAAVRSAFALRQRLPEVERYLAEATYHERLEGDRDATIRAYESLLEIDPDNRPGLNNLGLQFMVRGRFQEAETLFMRAIDVRPVVVGYYNLARARLQLGDLDKAFAALDSGTATHPEAGFVYANERVRFLVATGNYEEADSLAASFAAEHRRPSEAALAAQQRFLLSAVRGRFREAEQYVESFGLASNQLANPIGMAAHRSGLLLASGDSAAAAAMLIEAHSRFVASLSAGAREYPTLLAALLDAGGAEEAERIFAEWAEEIPDDELGADGRNDRNAIEAQLASSRGNLDEAVRLWGAHELGCPGWCEVTASIGLARVHEARGDVHIAIREYERYLARRPAGAPNSGYWDRWILDATKHGPVIERLGRLYDSVGDLENAARYYSMFVELWAGADQELQPRVRATQARLEELRRLGDRSLLPRPLSQQGQAV